MLYNKHVFIIFVLSSYNHTSHVISSVYNFFCYSLKKYHVLLLQMLLQFYYNLNNSLFDCLRLYTPKTAFFLLFTPQNRFICIIWLNFFRQKSDVMKTLVKCGVSACVLTSAFLLGRIIPHLTSQKRLKSARNKAVTFA